jgi:hypothetical protein
VGNQSVSNLPAIVLVTPKVPRQIPLLVEEPRRDDAAQHTAHTKAQSEPKASGVAKIINTPPEYIG